MAIEESQQHGIKVSDIGIPKEVMKDIDDTRALLREFISNAGAKEVGAETVKITKFTDPEYGLSFRVEDDGCGMDYTGDEDNQGRLDRFLNLGYSEVSGLESDEFSHKGLGTALMYNSRRVEVETFDGDTLYEVVIDDPRGHFWKEDPEPPVPRVTAHDGVGRDTGTKITVYGFDGGDNAHYKKYGMNRMEEYLRWRTLVGCTKEDRVEELPDFILNVEGDEKELETGYPWIEDDDTQDTVIFDTVSITREDDGVSVDITAKGGMTLNTSGQNLPDRRAGLTVSVNGIPYFRDRDFLQGRFSDIHWKFMNLVVECDELNLNISRNGYFDGDLTGELFEKGVKEALRKIENSDAYQEFAAYIRRKKREEEAGDIQGRKQDLQSESQKYVTANGERLHVSPKSEQDTLAVLWKMEAKDLLPFYEYTTLEHTSWKGIDLIADLQEESTSEKKECITIEVERDFSSFEQHGHHPGHTDYVICWNMNPGSVDGELQQLNDYKYSYTMEDQVIEVFVLNQMTGIEERQLAEIE